MISKSQQSQGLNTPENDAIVSLVRAINGLELDVEESTLPQMVQDAIQVIRTQRHSVVILSVAQLAEAAEFAGLDVFTTEDADALECEYAIRTGTILSGDGAEHEKYEGLLIESVDYPEDGAIPLTGEHPFKEYEPVIDEGFLRQAAKCDGWAGELARRMLLVMAAEPVAWRHDRGNLGIPTITVSKSVAEHLKNDNQTVTPLYEASPLPFVIDVQSLATEITRAIDKATQTALSAARISEIRRCIVNVLQSGRA